MNSLKKAFLEFLKENPLDHQCLLHAGIFACELTDHLIDTKAQPPDTIKCGPGCPHCCKDALPTITVPEALYINEYCKENNIKPKEYEEGQCPFLNDEGSCGVHPARPVRCRGWNSRDVEWCKSPPFEFNVRNCPVYYPQFQAARKIHSELINALEGVGYINVLTRIDHAFWGNLGVPAKILIEGLNMVMAGAYD